VLGYQVASVAIQQGLFIGGEQWLSSKIGCPTHYRRGKAEGNIKLEKGVHADLLTFPHSRGIILFDGATVANLSLNYENHFRDDLLLNINENNIPTSVFNEKYNELWYKDPTGVTYVYSFAVNNWIGKFSFNFDKMVSVRDISGTVGSDYKVIGAYNDYIFNSGGKTNIFEHLGGPKEASMSYVVSPSLNELVDFVDLTIHASNAPSEIQVFNKADFAQEPDSVINEVKSYSDELYYSMIPRSKSANRVHNTFVGIKIIEDALSANQLEVYSAKTGVRLVV
jgi:hypothetical protein